MKFQIIPRDSHVPKTGVSTAYLHIDRWNDFAFVTLFYLSLNDENGQYHKIGNVKIGAKGQETSKSTYETLENSFESLSSEYFSLGQHINYYRNLSSLSQSVREQILVSLNDMVFDSSFIDHAQHEDVFRVSLLRDVSLSVIKGQFRRVLDGRPPLTNFEFSFVRAEQDRMPGIDLKFNVKENSMPSTNIHAVIGRNGVGKTTLLNDMIEAITSNGNSGAKFYNLRDRSKKPISTDYFSSLVSVSFSAFDPFKPPREQPDPSKGTCYFYIGLKDRESEVKHRTIPELQKDCVKALVDCFRSSEKFDRWVNAIKKLSSDDNFDYMGLEVLEERYRKLREDFPEEVQSDTEQFRNAYFSDIEPFFSRMSSGHAVVLLTMTHLVSTVEEKTLVLLDEPESHLHPPLLSAFIRALSELLYDRNGVAIIATHSPVVLQEIPKSCVWKIHRIGSASNIHRPDIETFGENVGVLTREVFGLEVVKSGYHDLLTQFVNNGGSYEEILNMYGNQLGLEGRSILKALVVHRDRSLADDANQ